MKKRKPIVEGIFYPADPDELQNALQRWCEDLPAGTAQLIVPPHAALNIVGPLMAKAFSMASRRKIQTVVLISHVHREEQDHIIVPSFTAYETPLGEVRLNRKASHFLTDKDKSFIVDDIPHIEEHAIEDQLPFVKHFFPDSEILPILMGKTTISLARKLSEGLKRAFAEDPQSVLFVVTSNLSQYGKKEIALTQAEQSLKSFESCDWKQICEDKRTGLIEACGAGPLASVLAYMNTKMKMTLIDRYEPEGRESEKGKTVSYGALIFEEEENGSIK